jgi:hypothetical protein
MLLERRQPAVDLPKPSGFLASPANTMSSRLLRTPARQSRAHARLMRHHRRSTVSTAERSMALRRGGYQRAGRAPLCPPQQPRVHSWASSSKVVSSARKLTAARVSHSRQSPPSRAAAMTGALQLKSHEKIDQPQSTGVDVVQSDATIE